MSLNEDGTTALSGAYFDDINGDTNSGSAYVYDLSGSEPVETKLTPNDGQTSDSFGSSVSVNGDGTTALIGAYSDDTGASRTGSAYVYDLNGGEPAETKLTASDGQFSDNFGWSVSMSEDGTAALVGAYGDDSDGGTNVGSAYVYDLSGDEPTEIQKLTANDGQNSDVFGESVSISENGTTALVGALWDNTSQGTDAGSAYVFARSAAPVPIDSDVLPDSEENPINPQSRQPIPVVIYGTDDFDVTSIDVSTLTFDAIDTLGEDPDASPTHQGGHIEDVDGDGIDDLVVHFPVQETQIDEDEEVTLAGQTDDGTPIRGTDEVTVVGAGQGQGQGEGPP